MAHLVPIGTHEHDVNRTSCRSYHASISCSDHLRLLDDALFKLQVGRRGSEVLVCQFGQTLIYWPARMLSAVRDGAASAGVMVQDSLWAAYKSPVAQTMGKVRAIAQPLASDSCATSPPVPSPFTF